MLARHRHVGDDEVEVGDGGLAEGVLGVGGLADLPSAEPEEAGDPAPGVGFVVVVQGGQDEMDPVGADWAVQP